MARLNPFSIYPPSLAEALREILAVEPPTSKATPAKAHKKRQPTTRKANTARAKRKPKK